MYDNEGGHITGYLIPGKKATDDVKKLVGRTKTTEDEKEGTK